MSLREFGKRNHLILISLAIGLGFWIADAIIDVVFFGRGSLLAELLPHDPHELWMRGMLSVGILVFGGYAQYSFNQKKKADRRRQLAGTVFENASDAIMVTDEANCIIDVNPAFESITGYSKEDVFGKNPGVLKSGRHGWSFYRELWSRLERDGHWEGEIWDRRKDGEVYPKWLSIAEVKNNEGSLVNYVAIFRDISTLKETEKRLEYMAHYDALTGLANRSLVKALLDQAIHLASRNHWQLAVIFIDLDHFKEVNDSLGHNVGDLLLIEVANRLSACVRESDTVARLGGDEFVMLLEKVTSESCVTQIVEKVRASLSRPVELEGHEVFVSVSMGVSLLPADGEDADTLLRNADTAMYNAKKEGRNGWSFYSEDMNQYARRRLSLISGLRHAVEKNEFRLAYQPQVDLASGAINGAEALIRWIHPKLGMLSPAEFISLAEETGLIEELGDWVLEKACRQFRIWTKGGMRLPRISINLSPRQFRSSGFVENVERIVSEQNVDPSRIELEITETLLMRNHPRLRDHMYRLRDFGISFSLDDFGAGYSSLSYLKQFPISRIKADRSFIQGIPRNKDDVAITAAIISMAHNLSMQVVAEGVEVPEHVSFLVSQGCDEIQGYLVSRPLWESDFEHFMKHWKPVPSEMLYTLASPSQSVAH